MLRRVQRRACKPEGIRVLFVAILVVLLVASISRSVSAERQLSSTTLMTNSIQLSWESIGSPSPSLNSPSRLAHSRLSQDDPVTIPEFEGTIIDDLSDGFLLIGPDRYWHEETSGYQDHLWWTRNNATVIENKARWLLRIDQPGTYQLAAYIPSQHATSEQVRYVVYHQDQITEVTVNQNLHRNSWHSLGTFEFSGDGREYLELSDETGESESQYEIAFDAVGFRKVESGLEEVIADALWARVKVWLDDQAAEFKVYLDEWLERQKGQLLRQLGNALTGWIDEQCTGLGAAMALPLYALLVSRRRER